jgi:ornithine carbamoyltransferase
MMKDFLSIADWSTEQLLELLALSRKMKDFPAYYHHALQGKSIAMIFEKQSLRTHVTFDVGIDQLGAHSVYLSPSDISLGKRESVHDVAKNIERWVDGVVIRTFAHKTCTDMAKHMKIPVINALTDLEHPCQAVGDFLTILEHLGSFRKKKLVYLGDGNNVCHSLMLMAGKVGMNFTAVTPRHYPPNPMVTKQALEAAKHTGAKIVIVHKPKDGVRQADVIYTDVWASMGQEKEREQRAKDFKEFQVNKKLMSYARDSAIFMHCLPAHRGEEVTDEVIDSPQSVVFDEAENRLHTQKAIMYTLLHGVNRL